MDTEAVLSGGADTEADVPQAKWYGSGKILSAEEMMLAQECYRKGLHLVPEKFADLTMYDEREYADKWDWHSAVRERGYHQFSLRSNPGQTNKVLSYEKRDGAKYKYFKHSTRTWYLAIVICENCRAMHKLEGKKGYEADDEELLNFFLLRPLANPQAKVRWLRSADYQNPGFAYPQIFAPRDD